MVFSSFPGCFKRILKFVVDCRGKSLKVSETAEGRFGILGELFGTQGEKDTFGNLLGSILPVGPPTSSSVKPLPVLEAKFDFDISQNVYVAPEDIIKNAGYPAEIHEVTTEDGFILTLFRIPPTTTKATQKQHRTSKLNPKSERSKPVYIGHGLLSSAADWLMIDPSRALPFQLAKAGFDVWLGNCRGNDYALKHTKYSNNSEQFWDFSVHEMGKYDLPAIIDYILKKTKFHSINYVGYSQSTTSFFILMSERPEYNLKINKMVALAPAIYISNIKSPAKIIAFTNDEITLTLHKILSSGRLFPPEVSKLVSKVAPICGLNQVTYDVACQNLIFILAGCNPKENTNRTVIKRLENYFPSAASARTLIHYTQFFRTPKFRQYNWGARNPIYYNGARSPPKYHLNRTKATMLFIHGGSDKLTVPEDVIKTVQELKESNPNVRRITVDSYNHLDFVYADTVAHRVYDHITKFFSS